MTKQNNKFDGNHQTCNICTKKDHCRCVHWFGKNCRETSSVVAHQTNGKEPRPDKYFKALFVPKDATIEPFIKNATEQLIFNKGKEQAYKEVFDALGKIIIYNKAEYFEYRFDERAFDEVKKRFLGE